MTNPTDAWLEALPPHEEKLIRTLAVQVHAYYRNKSDQYNYNLAEDLLEVIKALGWVWVPKEKDHA